MYKNSLLLFIILAFFAAAITGCNSNKISCPTYANSFPEKKAKKSGKPKVAKPRKPIGGVMPGDGKGTRTVLPR